MYKKIDVYFGHDKNPPTGKNIFYQCLDCKYIIASEPDENISCNCGKLGFDIDAGRFFMEPDQLAVLEKVK